MLLLALINIALLAVFCVHERKLSVFLYSTVNAMLFMVPAILAVFLDAFHPRFREYFSEIYPTALLFVLLFNVIFASTFIITRKYMPESDLFRVLRSKNKLDEPSGFPGLAVFVAIVLIISVGSKLVLQSMGAFRMLDTTSASPLLQLYKEVGGLNLVLLAYLGELGRRPEDRRPPGIQILYAITTVISFAAAMVSGSRFQVLMVILLVAIAHRDFIRHHILATLASMVVVLPNLAVIFPLLSYYRQNGYDLGAAFARVSAVVGDRPLLLLQISTQRLNYLQIFASVIDQVKQAGPSGGAVYLNNFIGLIPRILWPGKPEISNNSRELGHILGIVTVDDRNTSIGLQIIGEAFYEFGWGGLMLAIVQGLLFATAERQLGQRNSPALFAFYIMTLIYLLSRDGYFAVLPGIIWLSAGFSVFLLLGHLCLRAPGSSSNVGYRRASQRL